VGSKDDGSLSYATWCAIGDWLGFTAERGKLFGVDACFVDQHDWNVFANRINAAARRAFQPIFIVGQLHRSFVQRANQNIQKFLRNGHQIPPSAL
jgi:hypothetical protein